MPLYKRDNSDIWWVNISHPNHPRVRRSTGTTDPEEAQRIHDQIKAKLWDTPKTLTGLTWGRAVEAWLDIEERSSSELLSLRKFGQRFKDRRLSQITGQDVADALSFCQTAGTYTRYRTMIRAILNVAKRRKWLVDVPDIPARRDKKKKTREWITPEQWDRLYAELPPHLKPPALFALNTGLRQSNVLGLTWRDVDLDRKLVVVAAEDTKDDDHLAVPLNDEAIAALQACQGVHPEFVFTYRNKPIVRPKAGFNDACTRAGIPDFTWHGLRHTWATWHIQNGTPVEVLQKLGGWADLRMVMNYAHHAPGFVAQFVNNVRKA
jgi:integrase